jgi:formamidopyrimidine-DNA glycosylase
MAAMAAAIFMPELPEVELVSRFLERLIAGRRIECAELLRTRLAPDTPSGFKAKLSGSRINFVHRRGKHILFDLDNGRTLVTHLRMSGRFMLLGQEDSDPKFTHAVFYFDDGQRLVFQDQRHFGFMRVAETKKIAELPEIRKLAPEPFSEEFSVEHLHSALRSTRRSIKEFLIDQSRVCGLGNIYAAEALFLAGIRPTKRTHTISRPRSALLHEMIRSVLSQAIEAGSTLNIDPSDSDSAYYGGEYERYWRVYDREDMPCSMCSTPIKRLKQGGRSTFYCPKCQRA